jgi:hypothetical protein
LFSKIKKTEVKKLPFQNFNLNKYLPVLGQNILLFGVSRLKSKTEREHPIAPQLKNGSYDFNNKLVVIEKVPV